MSQGLQIWDSNGIITLDTMSQTVKILGVFKHSPNPITITDSLLATETPFFIITPDYRQKGSENILKVTFNGNTCTIINSNAYNNRTIYIGVY